ncbi:MAG TPA: class I SAM-dependent methyltransferase [Archangium sp.]|nr:class I SAM-dependent methyltransferase [Archangium sp.]
MLLKVFVPPFYYGSYLTFDETGEPVGVLSTAAASVLRAAEGRPARELLSDGGQDVDPRRLDALNQLVDAGLIRPMEGRAPAAHFIEPDQASGTRHTGRGAELFIRYFYDYFGHAFYEGSPLIDSHGDFLSILSSYFPSRETPAVCLDAGTGSGYYATALAQRGHHVYACDISRTRLQAAAAQPSAPGTIQPVECSLDDIPLPDGCLDFAMCNFVLEHVADPYAVTEELLRLLRPGGTLLLAVPSFNVRDTLASWLHQELPTLNFEHLRSYGLIPRTHPWCEPTLDALQHLREHGADVVTVQGVNILNNLWEPWASAFGSIAAQLGPAFSVTWPWSCLGQQTIIHGRKRA